MSEATFWRKLGNEFKAIQSQYGEVRAVRAENGEWLLEGNREACERFVGLAQKGAARKGFCGDAPGALRYWLNFVTAANNR